MVSQTATLAAVLRSAALDLSGVTKRAQRRGLDACHRAEWQTAGLLNGSRAWPSTCGTSLMHALAGRRRPPRSRFCSLGTRDDRRTLLARRSTPSCGSLEGAAPPSVGPPHDGTVRSLMVQIARSIGRRDWLDRVKVCITSCSLIRSRSLAAWYRRRWQPTETDLHPALDGRRRWVRLPRNCCNSCRDYLGTFAPSRPLCQSTGAAAEKIHGNRLDACSSLAMLMGTRAGRTEWPCVATSSIPALRDRGPCDDAAY